MSVQWQHIEGPDGVTLPFAELHGDASGPTWLLTAGVHGDEYEGPAAIRGVVSEMENKAFPGRVIAVPVVNPAAYAVGQRCHPGDGGNLNRAFPGDAQGGPSARWAAFIWTQFATHGDRLIDLHAGGVTWHFAPLAGFFRAEDQPLAQAMGLTLWSMPETPGVFSGEFRRLRGPALGVELGHGGTRDDALVEHARQAIVSIITKPLPAIDAAIPVYRHEDVLSIADGEWSPGVRVGDEVGIGDALGDVYDWQADVTHRIVSRYAGKVLAVRRLVSTQRRDLLVVLGIR
jgi:predicted deacylase